MKRQVMQNEAFLKVLQKAEAVSGATAFFVGGFVRDCLLKIKTKDVDIVVVGNVQNFADKLKKILAVKCTKHERFGTYLFDNLGGFARRLDIASARSEVYSAPAALPTVVLGATLETDMRRRDFTINAMAVRVADRVVRKNIIDYFDGLRDLDKKLICVLHENSFIDDPTRIVRAIRFAVRFNFSIEKSTETLVSKAKSSGCIKKLSPARLGKELLAIFKEKNTTEIFERLRSLEVLGEFFPELASMSFLDADVKSAGTQDAPKKIKEVVDKLPSKKEFLNKYHFPKALKPLI